MKALAAALVAAQNEMPAVKADARNPHFNSEFVSLDHLIAQTKPVLTKHGLAIVQAPSHIDGQPALATSLIHGPSGESSMTVMPLVLGKQDMQSYGAALTYARRYAWAALLGICDESDDDGNRASSGAGHGDAGAGPISPKPEAARANPAPAPASGAPSDPGSYVWRFGDHTGKTIAETPLDALMKYAANEANNAALRAKCQAFIDQNAAPYGSFEAEAEALPF